MLHHCQDNSTLYPDFEDQSGPQLLFVCQTEGEESAIPRVMHKHDDRLEMMFIARGSGQYQIGGRQYLAQEGDILVFNQGVVHDERPHLSADSLIYSCGIHHLHLAGLPENHLIGREERAVVASGEHQLALHGLFEALCTQVFSKAPFHGVITHHLLNAIVMMCRNVFYSHLHACNQTEASLGLSIKEFIDEHYKHPLTLETIASQLGITRFYLIHVFKKFSGYSPKQYIIRCRVGEAQSLLVNTDLDVAAIASAVGYESVNNFHRVFKMVVGIPPTQYKNRWLAGIKTAS
ncbi:AraC family transcriptional regulator [Nissabacter sp. SGAir0207]|uniref:helix-turn-helix transcriptional regulator n=1 Tax=Nissabacter sp. SGAir0207 TaxID=2126321 RepID=UPI0010CD2AD0|nr:AraC family transcriptional regulator [Nissabacter sp. SGAir0207]QCR38284.1 AraC family transcriptional regulator [Nissabacter sp. SGAir0207]